MSVGQQVIYQQASGAHSLLNFGVLLLLVIFRRSSRCIIFTLLCIWYLCVFHSPLNSDIKYWGSLTCVWHISYCEGHRPIHRRERKRICEPAHRFWPRKSSFCVPDGSSNPWSLHLNSHSQVWCSPTELACNPNHLSKICSFWKSTLYIKICVYIR